MRRELIMKFFKKLSAILSGTLIILAISLIGTTGSASAGCLYQYNPTGFTTSPTPVFNSICGVPYGTNNEPNFVRMRPDINGDENTANNASYVINVLNSACTSGSVYDVWNYLHNDASPNYNPDVGDGSAVAKNVSILMHAPLGTTSNNFTFNSTISASNAASVSDSIELNCGSNTVTLSLVPGTVHVYSMPYGWQNLPDSSVNNPTPLGSTNAGLSSMGSGNVWGCWDYRTIVVYEVKVTSVPQQVVMPTCNLMTLENDNGVARIDNIEYTANSATVTGYRILVISNNITSTYNIGLNQLPFTYNMSAGNTYNFQAYVLSNLGNVTSNSCSGVLTVSTPTPPPQTPPTTPTPPPTPPTQLVNTGPGNVLGIFLGVTFLGAVIYNFVLRKRLPLKSNKSE